jgi:hypothetical protein
VYQETVKRQVVRKVSAPNKMFTSVCKHGFLSVVALSSFFSLVVSALAAWFMYLAPVKMLALFALLEQHLTGGHGIALFF